MRLNRIVMIAVLLVAGACLAGCHPGPIVDNLPKQSVGGTIAGIVTGTDTTNGLIGRKVTAVEVRSGAKYDTTTAANGGYTIQVPEGTYRLEVELRDGETLAKQPSPTRVNNSDLDPHRDFVITVRRGGL